MARSSGSQASGWAVGFVLFAGIMMIMSGVFEALAGFAGILEDKFYVVSSDYAYEFDATTWGWIHLVVGIIVAAAGVGVMSGRMWARIIGVGVASVSAIANFFFIPYYPFWSVLMIALDVFVIWALCVYGREEAQNSFR